MYMGHFMDQITAQVQAVGGPTRKGFMREALGRKWIQSGVTNWTKTLHKRKNPCCSLDMIGGDGTGIGIPLHNVKRHQPVWRPRTFMTTPLFMGGRMGRCAMLTPAGCSKSEMRECRQVVKSMLSKNENPLEHREHLEKFRDHIEPSILHEIERWTELVDDVDAVERECLRLVLQVIASEHCVTNIIDVTHVDVYIAIIRDLQAGDYRSFDVHRTELSSAPMGPEIVSIMQSQILSPVQKVRPQTLALLQYTGKLLAHRQHWSLIPHHHAICVFDRGKGEGDHEKHHR